MKRNSCCVTKEWESVEVAGGEESGLHWEESLAPFRVLLLTDNITLPCVVASKLLSWKSRGRRWRYKEPWRGSG
jgi:hypothetical protein